MAKFDAAAATAQYMATLSPAAHAKATAYTQGGEWILLWGALVSILISWLVLRSGILQRTRASTRAVWIALAAAAVVIAAVAFTNHKPLIALALPAVVLVLFVLGLITRGKVWLQVAAVAAVSGLVETVLGLPWSIYAEWWRETSYGLKSQPLPGWLSEQAIGASIGLVVSVITLSLLYFVIRRAPRTWWLWCGLGVGLLLIVSQVVLQPILEPIFNKYTPAPAGPVRDLVVAMGKAAGVPADKIYIYDGSKQSNRYTANVSGFGGSARVAMSDVMFKKDADLAEVKGVVGHEMGHYVHQHVLWDAVAFAVLGMVLFFLTNLLFMPVLRLTGAKGVAGISDPAGLPVLGIILTVLMLGATPVKNTIIRHAESDADRFSVEHFNEPDGLSKALVKTIEYRASSPSDLEEFIFYDHPSVEKRVRAAMEWKAAHMPPEPPAPAERVDMSGVAGVPAPKGSMAETVPSNMSVGEITLEPKKK